MESKALLQHIDKLPRLPKAISELLDAVNNDNLPVKEVAAKVAHDPVISARVLRLANSAHFGRSREVGSIDEAVVRLGMQTLRTLVIASAVIGAIPKVHGINLANFWGETFEVALHCQELAKKAGTPPEEAFTLGILHAIGDLLIATVEPEKSDNIRAAVAEGADKHLLEKELLGYDSAEIGAMLAQTWKFTPALVTGIRYQDDPKSCEPFSKLAALLALARRVVSGWDLVPDDQRTSWLSQLNTQVGLKLDMAGLAEKLSGIRGTGFDLGKQLA